MRKIHSYSFKCFTEDEDDNVIIEILSKCINKTAFIKECIRKSVDNTDSNSENILIGISEINSKLDTLINKAATETPIEDILHDTYKANISQDLDINNERIEPVSSIESNSPTVNEYKQPEEPKDCLEEEMKQNVFNCMSRFINM